MTKYEEIAIFLSAVAIIIPILQGLYKLLVRPKLEFYPTGRAYLLFNRSGSYIKIEGVYEAKRKPISVKNIQLIVKRKKDGAMLDLSWATFDSPVNQRIVGAVASSTELAHPFRIDSDNIVCAFTEFTDFYDSAYKKLSPMFDKYRKRISFQDVNKVIYDVNKQTIIQTEEYKALAKALEDELFWQISEYEMDLIVEYGRRKKMFTYSFDVTNEDYNRCRYNVKETLRSFLKEKYGMNYDFKIVQVKIR